jgi:hypothetical protein
MLGVETDFTPPLSPSCPNSLPDNHKNTMRMDNRYGLKEDCYSLREACGSHSNRSLHVKTTPGSDQLDTTLITDDEIPLSNYHHLYISTFFSNNNPKTTNIVKTNDDTSFINSDNNQRNQPHLAENTPTTLITSNSQHEFCTKYIPQHDNCDFLSPSEVTTVCTGQSPMTGFYELSDHNSVNVVKVNPLFMIRTDRLRKYHTFRTIYNALITITRAKMF